MLLIELFDQQTKKLKVEADYLIFILIDLVSRKAFRQSGGFFYTRN